MDKRQTAIPFKTLGYFRSVLERKPYSGLTLRLQIGVGTAECAVLLPLFH